MEGEGMGMYVYRSCERRVKRIYYVVRSDKNRSFFLAVAETVFYLTVGYPSGILSGPGLSSPRKFPVRA